MSGFHVPLRIPLSLALGLGGVTLAMLTAPGFPADAAPPAPPPAVQPTPVPMGKAAFAALLMQVQRRSFGDEKIQVARAALEGGQHLSCEQVSQLMRTSPAGDEQVKIAAALYPRLVDPENFTRLVLTLAKDSDRHKLRQLVGR